MTAAPPCRWCDLPMEIQWPTWCCPQCGRRIGMYKRRVIFDGDKHLRPQGAEA
ncbi:MAG: hypothetical protein WC683_15065 [bacterium]